MQKLPREKSPRKPKYYTYDNKKPCNLTKRLIHVLDDRLESLVKNLRVLKISLQSLEGGRIVISVTNTLVGNDLQGDEMMTLASSVALDRIGTKYATVGDKDGQIAKIIEMVIDRRDAELSNRGYDHRAMEWANLQ